MPSFSLLHSIGLRFLTFYEIWMLGSAFFKDLSILEKTLSQLVLLFV